MLGGALLGGAGRALMGLQPRPPSRGHLHRCGPLQTLGATVGSSFDWPSLPCPAPPHPAPPRPRRSAGDEEALAGAARGGGQGRHEAQPRHGRGDPRLLAEVRAGGRAAPLPTLHFASVYMPPTAAAASPRAAAVPASPCPSHCTAHIDSTKHSPSPLPLSPRPRSHPPPPPPPPLPPGSAATLMWRSGTCIPKKGGTARPRSSCAASSTRTPSAAPPCWAPRCEGAGREPGFPRPGPGLGRHRGDRAAPRGPSVLLAPLLAPLPTELDSWADAVCTPALH